MKKLWISHEFTRLPGIISTTLAAKAFWNLGKSKVFDAPSHTFHGKNHMKPWVFNVFVGFLGGFLQIHKIFINFSWWNLPREPWTPWTWNTWKMDWMLFPRPGWSKSTPNGHFIALDSNHFNWLNIVKHLPKYICIYHISIILYV